MGYSAERFKKAVSKQLICPICNGVLEDPITVQKWQHIFCRGCITKLLTKKAKCPVDNRAILKEDLRSAHQAIRNILSRLLINCDFAGNGCKAFVNLGVLLTHVKECEYNPTAAILCKKSCGLSMSRSDLTDHDCMKALRIELQTCIDQLAIKDKQIEALKEDVMKAKTDSTLATEAKLDTVTQELQNTKESGEKANKLINAIKQEFMRSIFKPSNSITMLFLDRVWWGKKLQPCSEYFIDMKSCGPVTDCKSFLKNCKCPEKDQDRFISCECPNAEVHKCGLEKINDVVVRLYKMPNTDIHVLLQSENVHIPKENVFGNEFGFVFKFTAIDPFSLDF